MDGNQDVPQNYETYDEGPEPVFCRQCYGDLLQNDQGRYCSFCGLPEIDPGDPKTKPRAAPALKRKLPVSMKNRPAPGRPPVPVLPARK